MSDHGLLLLINTINLAGSDGVLNGKFSCLCHHQVPLTSFNAFLCLKACSFLVVADICKHTRIREETQV